MAKLKSLEYKKHLAFQLFTRKLAEGKAAQPRYRQTSTLLTMTTAKQHASHDNKHSRKTLQEKGFSLR
jgi:hypothetical protein